MLVSSDLDGGHTSEIGKRYLSHAPQPRHEAQLLPRIRRDAPDPVANAAEHAQAPARTTAVAVPQDARPDDCGDREQRRQACEVCER